MIVRGTLETLADRRGKMVAAFAGFGVTPARVFMALGVKAESEITLDHIIVLRGMFEALREQSITPEEMFDPRRMVGADFDKVENPMADDEHDETAGMGQPAGGQAKTPAPAQAQQPTPAQSSQPQQQTGTGEGQPAATAAAADPNRPQPTKRRAGRPTNEEKAARAAAAAGEPAKSDAKPAETVSQAQNPPAAQQQPQPAQQTAPPAQQAPAPRDTAGYEQHLRTWLAACTTGPEVDDRWKQKPERELRTLCSIIEDDFERMKKLKDARIAELKKA
jgi:hypothetical protein